jgi:pSer/pThr/pTyr-binding forkhead associated (FHA) protein
VEPPDAPSYERDLDGPEIIIGRAPTASLVITDSSASRHHARLFERDGQWWVEDLGTRNGTWLNDRPVTAASNLQPGDRIRLGDTVVRVDHRDIGLSGHRSIGTSGHRAIGPSSHRAIGLSGHRDIGTSSHRDIGTSGQGPVARSRTIVWPAGCGR